MGVSPVSSGQRSMLRVVSAALPEDRCALLLAAVGEADAGTAGTGASVLLDDVAAVDVSEVWWWSAAALRGRCNELLHGPVAIDLDQSWVRHQPAPSPGLDGYRPHSWHQDGALHFDFLAHAGTVLPAGELLPMVTCWIALTRCGVDAPGLELVAKPAGEMLAPLDLRDDVVDVRWPDAQRLHPILAAGDAIVFTGEVLHRTFVTSAMTQSRTSVELRCFAADAIPDRVREDRFVVPQPSAETPAWRGPSG